MRTSRTVRAGGLAVVLVAGSFVATATGASAADSPAPAPAPAGGISVRDVRPDTLPYDSPRAAQEPTSGLRRDATATPTRVHELEVVVAVPRGDTADQVASWVTPSAVDALVQDVSDYWSAQTGGKVTFAVDGGKVTYLQDGTAAGTARCVTDDDFTSLWSQASTKLYGEDWWNDPAAGPTARQHLVVLYPYAKGDSLTGGKSGATCGGTLGIATTPTTASLANPGLAFALFGGPDGAASSQYYEARQTLAHELGHNFGLQHSGTAWCPGSHPDGAFTSSSCGTLSYQDPFDLMGGGFSTHGITALSTPQKARLGLTTGQVSVAPTSATKRYTLTPVGGAGAAGTQAVTVVDPLSHERYYVEYRAAGGGVTYPAGVPGTSPVVSSTGTTLGSLKTGYGVRILRLAPASADATSPWAYSYEQSVVPVNAPGSTTTRTSYLAPGRTFTTRSGQVHVAVSGTSSVTVSFTAAAPKVTLTRTHTTQHYAGTPVKVTATLAKTDGYVPTGTLTFKDGSTTLKAVKVSSSGKASYTLPKTLKVGKHSVVAVYSPDATAKARNLARSVAKTTVTVAKATAKASVKLAHSTVARGAKPQVTVTLRVTGVPSPTGTVKVVVHGHTVKTVRLTGSKHGKITVTLPRTTARGAFSVVATYSGSSTVASARSRAVTLHVR